MELRDARRGSRALSMGVENKPEAPFLPSNRCLSLGPSPPSLRPRPSPLPPKSYVLCGLVPGLPGAGPEDPDVTCQGGRAAREGGGDWPRLSTSESSLPCLVLLRNRRRGREPGAPATGAAAGGWPWRGRGVPADRGPSRDPAGGPGRRAGWGGQLEAAAVATHLDGSELCPDHHGSGVVLQESVFPQCGCGA